MIDQNTLAKLASISMPTLVSKPWCSQHEDTRKPVHAPKDHRRWRSTKIRLTARNLLSFLKFVKASDENSLSVQRNLLDLELDLSKSDLADVSHIPELRADSSNYDISSSTASYYNWLARDVANSFQSMIVMLKELLDGCRRLRRYSYKSSPTLDTVTFIATGQSILDTTLSPMLGMGSLRRIDIDTTNIDWTSPRHHLCPVLRQLLCNVSELHLSVRKLCPLALCPEDRKPIALRRMYITIVPPLTGSREWRRTLRGKRTSKVLALRCNSKPMEPFALYEYEMAMKKQAARLVKQMRNPEVLCIEMPVISQRGTRLTTYMSLFWRRVRTYPNFSFCYECFDAISKVGHLIDKVSIPKRSPRLTN